MSTHSEHHRTPARIAPFVLALVTQAALFLALLSWVAGAQEAVEAATPLAAPRTTSTMPRAVSSFGAAELDGWLYVTGGHSGRTHEYSRASQWDGFVRLRAEDLAVREDLPGGEHLQGTALVAAGGRIVRIGGMRAGESGDEDGHASVDGVAAFDPATRSWSQLPSLPSPRSSHDAAAIGAHVYVFGGWNLAGHHDEAAWAEQGLALDLEHPESGWHPLPQPFVQRGVAVAAGAGEVFVVGGMDREGEFSSAVDVFDPGSNAWRKAPDFPGQGFGVAATVAGDRLYAAGREGDVWCLALDAPASTARWEACGELFVPRIFHRILPAGDGLAVLGGVHTRSPVGWIEHLRPGAAASSALFALPFAGRARQRQALFAHEGTLFLFGGNVALEQHAFEPGDFLAESWRFELGAASASALPPLPRARQSMVCVAAPDGKSVYALGGFGHDGEKDRAFDEIWRCELESGVWSVLDARLPHPMTQFRVLEHGDELLLLGGMDFDREREQKMQLLDTVYRADARALDGGFRDSGIRLPAPRRAFGAALLGDELYLAGGLDAGFEAFQSFDVYDFAARTWATLPAPSQARLSPELVVLGDKLYLVAGLVFDAEGRALPAEKIEEFDPARGTWRTLPVSIPIDPHEVQAFVWRDKLAMVSTWNERGVLELALLDPEAQPVMR
jgi:N-acetylneuraminic acid mutarotase